MILTAVTIFLPVAATAESLADGSSAPPGLQRFEERIRQREYQVTWQTGISLRDLDEAWHAPNRAQGFRAYFTGEALRLVPRTEPSPSWEWGLELTSYERGRERQTFEESVVRTEGHRIEYQRGGGLVEWFENTPRGLKHGFDLAGPPRGDPAGGASSGPGWIEGTPEAAGRDRAPGLLEGVAGDSAPGGGPPGPPGAGGSAEPLRLEMRLTGTLSPHVSADGRSISFTGPEGERVIRYAELAVRDSSGRDLVAWMEAKLRGGRHLISILVDDTEAIYPLTVDPLASSPAWSAAGGQAGSEFGFSVATAGDVNGDLVSDLLVGAHGYDNGQSGEGAVFLFLGSASGLSASPDWSAESNQADARFGISVATAGDVNGDGFRDVVVGADGYDNGQADEGRVFLFMGSASGLPGGPAADPNDADWTAEIDEASARFGVSVAPAGDVNGDLYSDLIVGADLADQGQVDEGRVFVYLGSSSGLPGGPHAGPGDADWSAGSDQADARLGVSVAPAGDVNGDGYSDVIVGAELYDNGQVDEGMAFVFLGSASGLPGGPSAGPADAAWTAESDRAGVRFGHAVSTAGDVNGDGYSDVIAGAHLFFFSEADEGRVYLWHGSASGLSGGPHAIPPTADWKAQSDKVGARFGVSVAAAGDVNGDGFADVVVGADGWGAGQQVDGGAAFLFLGSAAGLPGGPNASPENDAAWILESGQEGAGLGISVATAGDVDGDGLADIAVGAHLHDGVLTDEGAAFVFHGSPSGVQGSPEAVPADAGWTFESGQLNAEAGLSAASAGDVNGDGYSDVIVGAARYDNGQVDEGAAFVFLGSPSGPSNGPGSFPVDADWMAEGDQADGRFGRYVATAGDVNGDGFDDVIVGAWLYDNGALVNAGRAFVYHGSAAGLTAGPAAGPGDADWSLVSDEDYAQLGRCVGSAGDVNGDGFSDVIVGAYTYDNGESNEGMAFVFYGSGTGLSGGLLASPGDADWTAESNEAEGILGASVSTAGDVNGDGYSDVLVSLEPFDGVSSRVGSALLFHGSAAGLSGAPHAAPGDADWVADTDDYDGSSLIVNTAGDVNGDGFADVILGATGFQRAVEGGAAFVYHGSASGLSPSAGWVATGGRPYVYFGSAVATAGDVNGDGFADVIIGARQWSDAATDDGRAFVFLGSSTGLPGGPVAGTGEAAWSATADQVGNFGAELGGSVATAGDVNGDGFADIIVGARRYHNDLVTNQGSAFVFFGSEGSTLGAWPRQRRADDTAPVAHLGGAGSPDGFLIKLVARSPFGRGLVKLESEVSPLGSLFDGASTRTGPSWTDTGSAGVELEDQVDGLAVDSPYHWRARVLHHPAGHPLQPAAGRWITVPLDGWEEADLRTGIGPNGIGDRVWVDQDGDGIQDPGEPGLGGVTVELLDGSPPNQVLAATVTNASGIYAFGGLTLGETYIVRVSPPSGYGVSPQDQGADDSRDSDFQSGSLETPVFTLTGYPDPTDWDAGLVALCTFPGLAVDLTGVTHTEGSPGPGDETTLTFQDPNPPGEVTGYNIYRSSDPSQAYGAWTRLAAGIADEDPGTPGIQWTDDSGDPPAPIWYYQVTAVNGACGAEGPF